MKIFLISLVLLSTAVTFAETKPASPPQWKKLSAFLGTWKSHGQLFDTPFSKSKEVDSTTNCFWSKSGDYMICDQTNSMPAHQLTIYSAGKGGDFVAYTIGDPGVPPHMTKLTLNGNTWTYSSDFENNGKKTYFRTTNSFTSPEIYTFEAQYSEDGKHWKTMAQGSSRREK